MKFDDRDQLKVMEMITICNVYQRRNKILTCTDGFQPVDGICIDVDECITDPPCPPDTTCVNNVGGYQCIFNLEPTCPPFSCLIFCEHGNQVDENGCKICACNPPPEPTCPPFSCLIFCEHGNQVDENGCKICACNPPPEPTCPPFVCLIFCEHGNQEDENGCKICACNPPPEPTCPPFSCLIFCEHGNQVDENGCKICACNPPPEPTCPPVSCLVFCVHGNQVDENGCKICACNPPPEPTCPPFICLIFCEHGNQVDENGCEICACNPPPEPTCPPLVCLVFCKHGNQFDDNGCQLCACNAPPSPTCPPLECLIFCEFGYHVDDRGCDICACNPPPAPACPPINCQLSCTFGFVKDSDGECDICECFNPFQEAVCSPLFCKNDCGPIGYTLDSDGCKTCQCNYLEDVPIPPQISKVSRTKSVGKELELQCEADGVEQPSITWKKDGIVLEAGDGIELEGDTLSIQEREAHDNGMYQCVATNSIGTAESGFLDLRVGYMNDIPKRRLRVHRVKVNQFYKFICDRPNSYPTPRVYWSKGRYSIPMVYDNRVYQDSENNLVISNAKPEDSDVYVCVIFNDLISKSVFSRFHRLVLSGRAPTDRRSVQLATPMQETVYVVSGDTFNLWCSPQGFPTPTTVWEKLNGSLSNVVYENGGLKLTVFNAAYEDSGRYKCSSQNGIGDPFEGFVDVVVGDKPSWLVELKSIVLSVEDSVTLACEAEGIPDVTYDWMFNGKSISLGNVRVADHTLQINTANLENRGVYTCKASNRFGTILSNGAVNVVEFTPRVIQSSNRNLTVSEDQSVVLHCQGYGAPVPTIVWKSDKYGVIDSNSKFEVRDDEYLIIHDVEVSEGGIYTCVVSNVIGEAQVNFNILVQGSDKIVMDAIPRNQAIIVGQSASFKCQVQHSNTEVTDIEWQDENGEVIGQTGNASYVVDDNNTLSILSAGFEDQRQYTCVARTDRIQGTASVRLFVNDIPQPPTDVKVEMQEDLLATLSWTPSFDGNTAILLYIVEYTTQHEGYGWRKMQEVNGASNSIILNLLPGNEYRFRVFAENIVARSAPSLASNAIVTAPSYPSRSPEEVKVHFSGDSLIIEWSTIDPVYYGSSDQDVHYAILIQASSSLTGYTVTLPVSATSYIWGVINPSETYSVVVQTVNSYGVGPVASPITPECVPVHCSIYCVYGFVYDNNGCQLCQCSPPPPTTPVPTVACVTVTCIGSCPGGRRVDENGCQTCECIGQQAPVSCPPMADCQMFCSQGFVKDKNGCDTCECLYSATDDTNGPVIKCEPFQCSLECNFGYETNDFGCTVCECFYPTSQSDISYVDSAGDDCPPFVCDKFCFFGYEVDSDYCRICTCRAYNENLLPPAPENVSCFEKRSLTLQEIDSALNSGYLIAPFPEAPVCDKDGHFVEQSCTVETGCICVNKFTGFASQLEYPDCAQYKPCLLHFSGTMIEAIRSAGYGEEANQIQKMVDNQNLDQAISILAVLDEELVSVYLVDQFLPECDSFGDYNDKSRQLSTGSSICNYRNGTLIPSSLRTFDEPSVNCYVYLVDEAPSIVFDTQPSDSTVKVGGNVTLSCAFSEVEGYVYWVKNDIPVNVFPHGRYQLERKEADKTYNLLIVNAQKEDEGGYTCGVSLKSLSKTSSVAYLTVSESTTVGVQQRCFEKRDFLISGQELLKELEVEVPDVPLPSCTADGRFEVLQCVEGTGCYCVDSDSGEFVELFPPDCVPVEDLTCAQVTASIKKAQQGAEAPGIAGVPTLTCSEDGNYEPVQCVGGVGCYCVDTKTGQPSGLVPPNCVPVEELTCALIAASLKAQKDAGAPEVADLPVPTCAEDGNYEALQCITGLGCVCVDPVTGQPSGLVAPNCAGTSNTTEAGKCAKEAAAINKQLEEAEKLGTFIADLAPPSCTPDGNYELYQCSLEPGLCLCVDAITGESSGLLGPDCVLTEELTCAQVAAALETQLATGLLSGIPGVVAPTCTADGNYAPLQCITDLGCACVDTKTGQPSGLVAPNCEAVTTAAGKCAMEAAAILKQLYDAEKEGTYIADLAPPTCTLDGNYDPLQCFPLIGCYCVDTQTGSESGLTAPACVPTTPQPETKTCAERAAAVNKRLDDAAKAGTYIADLVPPSCTLDGNYEPHQCFPLIGCYCVDSITGEPSGLTAPACETVQKRTCAEEAAAINKQLDDAARAGTFIADLAPPTCTPDGNYELYQCVPLLGCFCVYALTGEKSGLTAPDCVDSAVYYVACAAVAAGINETLEDAKRTGVTIADLVPPSCTEDGNYKKLQCLPELGCFQMISYIEQTKANAIAKGLTVPDLVPLNCSEDGRYKAVQCHHSKCFLVDEETGNFIRNIEPQIGTTPTPPPSFTIDVSGPGRCAEVAAEIVEQLAEAAAQGRFIADLTPPSCTVDGNFMLVQCRYPIECHCVDQYTGEPSFYSMPNCQAPSDCAIQRQVATEANQAFIPECDIDGSYKSRQCSGSICWCTLKSGAPIQGTTHKDSNSINCNLERPEDSADASTPGPN
ncbi:uncharacterized protein LOC117100282 [Anneissia japonica]|uniref:uncharacterized protein LOC117100282 n=1 Tax=Anneissia japonica TaxID=1529436 RepID=UPI00142567A3|nr:uncharacterized protein LOC117100282 [Anneissia japonica]